MTFAVSDAGRLRIACSALFLVTLLLFSRAIGCDFLDLDDPDFLTQNPSVQAGLNWQSVHDAFTSNDAGNWYPLTRLSHVAAWQFFGADPRGHHAVNVILHALNAVLAFLALKRLTGAFWTSAASAALFAWHPLRVESVAWVAERKDVLSVFFALLTILAYAVYAEKYRTNRTTPWRWYGLTLIAFAAGLLCKPMLVTLPFALLLLDLWPLERCALPTTRPSAPATHPAFRIGWHALLLEKTPFLLLSAGSCYITYLIQQKSGGIAAAFSVHVRLTDAALSVIRYLGKFFWPFDLTVAYAHPTQWPIALTIGSVFLLIAITGLALYRARSHPWLIVGWFWFIGMLVPVIGLVQSGLQSMADRYTYLPILGLQLALLWTAREQIVSRGQRLVGGITTALILVFCVVQTWNQIGYWSNSRILFEHALAVSGKNYLAHSYLATSFANAGQLDSAILHYQRSLALDPDYAAAHYGLAVALEKKGQADEALIHYRQAVKLRSPYPQAHFGLGLALLKREEISEARVQFQAAADDDSSYAPAQRGLGLIAARAGNLQEATRYFETALKLDPQSNLVHRDYARVLAGANRHAEACVHFRTALLANPTDASLHYELGLSLQAINHDDEAESSYATATRLDPTFAEAHYNLGVILMNKNQLNEATNRFRSAVASRPDFVPAYFALGIASTQSNQLTEAIVWYKKALSFSPDNAEIHNALGYALSQNGNPTEAQQHWEQAFRLDPTISGLVEALANAHHESHNQPIPTQP